jgi:hypothetical protein
MGLRMQPARRRHSTTLDRGRAPLAVLGAPLQGGKCRRHVPVSERDARLDRRFHVARGERATVGERDSAAKIQQEGTPRLEHLPLLAQCGGEVAAPVGGEQV